MGQRIILRKQAVEIIKGGWEVIGKITVLSNKNVIIGVHLQRVIVENKAAKVISTIRVKQEHRRELWIIKEKVNWR